MGGGKEPIRYTMFCKGSPRNFVFEPEPSVVYAKITQIRNPELRLRVGPTFGFGSNSKTRFGDDS